ncbi:FAD-dependent monooxygenase [Aurantimonas sp. E1-2-R+4]|uniref:FAD-dependent monooxygenase n=1 Tax=Aurantimonas sp. E1-2-R+4 TaxID=3113714 RepID=UPI002F959855
MKIEVDVAILGNSVAANSLAIALARTGTETVVLGTPRRNLSYGEHLKPGVTAIASSIGLDFASLKGSRITHGNLSLWGTPEPVAVSYLGYPEGSGHNLDRDVFDKSLRTAANRFGSLRIDGFKILVARVDKEQTVLTGTLNKCALQVTAKLAVDASGRSAALGRRLGARVIAHDRLLALGAIGPATRECDTRLALEAAPDGWWYAVPIAEDRVIAVFLTDSDLLPAGMAKRCALWKDELKRTRLIASRMSQGAGETYLHQADSRSLWLTPQGARGWIAIGDAAMAFDPISGSGITKAMADAGETAEAIACQLAGDGGPMARLLARRRSRFESYLAERAAIYRAATPPERGEFWSRRLTHTQP